MCDLYGHVQMLHSHKCDSVGIFLFTSCGLSKQQDILWWNIRTKTGPSYFLNAKC